MSETVTAPVAPTSGGTFEKKSKAPRNEIRQKILDDASTAREIFEAATKPEHTPILAKEGIDEAFVEQFSAQQQLVDGLISEVSGNKAAKVTSTLSEEECRERLLAQIAIVQARVKVQFDEKDPVREQYYIGKRYANNRPLLEAAAKSIQLALTKVPVKTMTPENIEAFNAAVLAYIRAQGAQSGERTNVATTRESLEKGIKELTKLRRKIQFAVDAAWPPRRPENAGIRREFKMHPDRLLK